MNFVAVDTLDLEGLGECRCPQTGRLMRPARIGRPTVKQPIRKPVFRTPPRRKNMRPVRQIWRGQTKPVWAAPMGIAIGEPPPIALPPAPPVKADAIIPFVPDAAPPVLSGYLGDDGDIGGNINIGGVTAGVGVPMKIALVAAAAFIGYQFFIKK